MYTRLDLNSQRPTRLCLPGAGIKDMCHTLQLPFPLFNSYTFLFFVLIQMLIPLLAVCLFLFFSFILVINLLFDFVS